VTPTRSQLLRHGRKIAAANPHAMGLAAAIGHGVAEGAFRRFVEGTKLSRFWSLLLLRKLQRLLHPERPSAWATIALAV
jgi:hypothetical protein